VFANYLLKLYIIIVKPYTSNRENFVEILNEIVYIGLSLPLVFLDSLDKWNEVFENIFYGVIIANIALNAFISFFSLGKWFIHSRFEISERDYNLFLLQRYSQIYFN